MKTQSFEIHVDNEDGTAALTQSLSQMLKGKNACIELIGDVGSGKTTFTQHFSRELGSKDSVTSPTFTIENIYQAPENIIHHFDLYRLENSGLLPEEVNEALTEEKSIVIVEWAGLLTADGVLPENRIKIEFLPLAHSEQARKIVISAPEELDFSQNVIRGA